MSNDTNGEDSIDDAQRQVVVAVLFGLIKVRKVEFGFTVVYKYLDFGFGEHELQPGING